MRKKLFLPLLLLNTGLLGSAQNKPLTGFSATASSKQVAAEQQFDSYLLAKNVDRYIKDLSARPHHVGSPGGEAVTQYILNHFKNCGFDAHVETFYVLFPTPKERLLEMTGPVKYKAVLAEPPLKEDATSGQTAEQLPVYNAFSADGDVRCV